MRNRLLVCIVFLLTVFTVGAFAENIVDNSDFLSDFDYWEQSQAGVGDFTVEVLPYFEGYDGVLHVKRTNSGSDGGRVSIWQRFSTYPGDCVADQMKISARFKIVSHSLTSSGWASTAMGGIGEYPLHFKVSSNQGAAGPDPINLIWNMGFLTQTNTEPLTNYIRVPLNTWVQGSVTIDLDGYSLTGLCIDSNGWDYEIYLDYITIEPIP
jgi:hypothetical protein